MFFVLVKVVGAEVAKITPIREWQYVSEKMAGNRCFRAILAKIVRSIKAVYLVLKVNVIPGVIMVLSDF